MPDLARSNGDRPRRRPVKARRFARLPAMLATLAVAAGVVAAGAGLSVFYEAWVARGALADTPPPVADAVAGPVWLDDDPARASTPLTIPAPAIAGQASDQDDRASSMAPGARSAGGLVARADAPTAPAAASVSSAQTPVATVGDPTVTSGAVSTTSGAREAATDPVTDRSGRAGSGMGSGPGVPEDGLAPAAGAAEPDIATLAGPGDIELVEVDFRFLNPPEPGAHARLAVTVANRTDRRSPPVVVAIPERWLGGFRVLGAVPDVLDDRAAPADDRRFVWLGLEPRERRTVELHVISSGEEVDAPAVRAELDGVGEIARAQPRTVAPRPRPGPVRAVSIPKLSVRASVIPVTWEPPPFVVGQIQGSSAVSEGNSVLIGHLAGPLGDVFARLDRLRPGDEIVATSRGLEYRFVVSELTVRPYQDIGPTLPTDTPRLTLMTCTGTWNVLRQDYSHRLWVVAEPPELAAGTIRANAERAAEAAREADAAAAARAAHEASLATPGAEPAAPAAVLERPAEPTAPATVLERPAEPARETAEAVAAPAAGRPSVPSAVPSPPVGSEVAGGGAGADASAPVADADGPAVRGLSIVAPADGSRVGPRITLTGRVDEGAETGAGIWIVVRPLTDGGRWYALPTPPTVRPDGTWTADLELGGAAGIQHEIHLGAGDTSALEALRRHARDHAGQPLDEIPPGFATGARIVVTRG